MGWGIDGLCGFKEVKTRGGKKGGRKGIMKGYCECVLCLCLRERVEYKKNGGHGGRKSA